MGETQRWKMLKPSIEDESHKRSNQACSVTEGAEDGRGVSDGSFSTVITHESNFPLFGGCPSKFTHT